MRAPRRAGQAVGEGRDVLPMRPGADARQDHEYVRGGLCCAFLAFEPLQAWRRVWIRPQRRRLEFAEIVRALCDEVYPEAAVIRIVCDNLNDLSRMAGRTPLRRSTSGTQRTRRVV